MAFHEFKKRYTEVSIPYIENQNKLIKRLATESGAAGKDR